MARGRTWAAGCDSSNPCGRATGSAAEGAVGMRSLGAPSCLPQEGWAPCKAKPGAHLTGLRTGSAAKGPIPGHGTETAGAREQFGR